MDSDLRIIKYIEDELNANEKIQFENDLKTSKQLKDELDKYFLVKSRIKETKAIRLNKNYSDQILFEFRKNIQQEKFSLTRRNMSYAIGMIAIAVISFIILENIFTSDLQVNSIQDFTESLNEKQSIELLENLSDDTEDYNLIAENIPDLKLTKLFETDLTVDNEIAEKYNISYPELLDELNSAEAEKIYKEILINNFNEVEL